MHDIGHQNSNDCPTDQAPINYWVTRFCNRIYSDNKVHGVNMGPTWVLSAPDRPHVGPMTLAIRVRDRRHIPWNVHTVQLCCVWWDIFYRFSEDSCHALIHIIHDCFTGTRQPYDCSNAYEPTMVDIGLTGWYRILTKTRRANRMHNSEDGIYFEWVFGHLANMLAFSDHNNKKSNQDLCLIIILK